MIAPELMCHVALPYIGKEFQFHRGCDSSLEDEKVINKVGRRSSLRHSIHLVHIQTKRNSATICGLSILDQLNPSTTQRITILAVVSERGEQTLFERLSTPRPAPKIGLYSKVNWQLEQQQDTLEGPTSAGIGKPLRGLQPSTSTVALTPASIGKPL